MNPDIIINVGSGDGYYGIGLGRHCPNAKVLSTDISEKYINMCRENASLNNLTNIGYSTISSTEMLSQTIGQSSTSIHIHGL
jgi:methylase of polypeptide subunit release factors